MPTTKPRISITIDAEHLAVLDRFALATGTPRASVIGELVRGTIPELERAAKLIEMANAAPAGVLKGLVGDLERATDEVMGSIGEAHEAYERVLTSLKPPRKPKPVADRSAAPGARARRAPGGGGRSQTPTY